MRQFAAAQVAVRGGWKLAFGAQKMQLDRVLPDWPVASGVTMKIVMIGTGYVGLVTGTCFAAIGHSVTCYDKLPEKIEMLEQGQIPIYEPGLAELVAENRSAGRLSFTTALETAMEIEPDFVFVAVGTPQNPETGHADLSFVYAAVEEVTRILGAQIDDGAGAHHTVMVTKSTVPVGTSEAVKRIAARFVAKERISVASNPEFLREGAAIKDFMEPDRIVVGSDAQIAGDMLNQLYKPLTDKGFKLVATTTVATAELIKYAANSFLVTKISFINEIARLCEKADAKVDEVAMGIGLDDRIGNKFLNPGPGYGGSCFPKDTTALIKTAADFGSRVTIIEAVVAANDTHQKMMVEKVRGALGGLHDRRIGVLGLTFKANTDDVRDSPSLVILPELLREGARVIAYDPKGSEQARQLLPGIEITASHRKPFEDADALIIITEWPEFKNYDWAGLRECMRAPVLIDLRNLLDPAQMAGLGYEYHSLGR